MGPLGCKQKLFFQGKFEEKFLGEGVGSHIPASKIDFFGDIIQNLSCRVSIESKFNFEQILHKKQDLKICRLENRKP